MTVFVFGNGLSIGPSEGRMSLPELTPAIWTLLDDEGLGDAVRELVRWASPDAPELADQDHHANFEKIAGALHRLSWALEALRPFVGADLTVLEGLDKTATQLARWYQRIVAAALLRIDEACYSRKWGWATYERDHIKTMAESLVEVHKQRQPDGIAIYTLNYDSMLIHELLEAASRAGVVVYDGFVDGQLDVPLDPYPGRLTLYALHGTTGTYVRSDGTVMKHAMDRVRQDMLLERWMAGDVLDELPRVVLGDAKETSIRQEPFATFYAQLRDDLARTNRVVVGGYGFGDSPLNRVLAAYLAENPDNRLHDWRPNATNVETRAAALNNLRKCVGSMAGKRIDDTQLLSEDVSLPNADAVANL